MGGGGWGAEVTLVFSITKLLTEHEVSFISNQLMKREGRYYNDV